MIFAAQRIAKESPEKSQKLGLLLVVGEEVDHVGMIVSPIMLLQYEHQIFSVIFLFILYSEIIF